MNLKNWSSEVGKLGSTTQAQTRRTYNTATYLLLILGGAVASD